MIFPTSIDKMIDVCVNVDMENRGFNIFSSECSEADIRNYYLNTSVTHIRDVFLQYEGEET
jgi:hypothetical protein